MSSLYHRVTQEPSFNEFIFRVSRKEEQKFQPAEEVLRSVDFFAKPEPEFYKAKQDKLKT